MIEEIKSTPYLTTVDNVWNPFTNFDEWLAYDISNEHYSNATLAKIALVSDALSDEENRQEIERAIDRIIELDPTHEFCKVYSSSYDDDIAKARQQYMRWYNALDKQIKDSIELNKELFVI